jgi:16S rRNA (guanine527-N7)-methyltransferase
MRFGTGDIVANEAQSMQLLLSAREIHSFEVYSSELVKWNSKFNLTSITNAKEIAVKHFVDSLSLAPYITADDRLLDIGSGAGLPVIPLKIIMPEVPMVSVDSVAKKIHFQRHVIRLLNLLNIEAIHARIEELHKTHPHAFSVITSRAFTRLDRFVSLAAPLLSENGVIIAMKGGETEEEIAASEEVVHANGFTVTSVLRYALPYNMGDRVLTFINRANPR